MLLMHGNYSEIILAILYWKDNNDTITKVYVLYFYVTTHFKYDMH